MRIKPVKQSKGYCGPASMKMIMDYYGIIKSQNYWARITKTTRDKGCSELQMVMVAKKFGLESYIKQYSSLGEIKKLINNKIPVIVDWYSPEEEGHYSVVTSIGKGYISLADSHFGKIKRHSLKWFLDKWFDMVNSKKITREIIVIKEKE